MIREAWPRWGPALRADREKRPEFLFDVCCGMICWRTAKCARDVRFWQVFEPTITDVPAR